MRYDRWRQRTPVLVRSQELKAVDDALLRFNQTGLKEDLLRLSGKLAPWKSAPASAPASIAEAIAELSTWIDKRQRMFDEDQSQTIPLLRDAALKVIDAYGGLMPEHYRAALQGNFIANGEHVYCYKRYETSQEWKKHCDKLTASRGISETDVLSAATPTISPATMCIEDQEYAASRNLKNSTPPYDRRIEFHAINLHTAVHEMLHWCCHEDFRKMAPGGRQDKEFHVLEGLTEWLACKALGEWGTDSYRRIMGAVRRCVEAGHPTFDSMVAAYFKGTNVKGVAEDMLAYVKEDLAGVEGRQNEIERDQCVAAMTRSRKNPATAGEPFQERVKKAFAGVSQTAARSKLAQYAAWVDFLIAEGVLR